MSSDQINTLRNKHSNTVQTQPIGRLQNQGQHQQAGAIRVGNNSSGEDGAGADKNGGNGGSRESIIHTDIQSESFNVPSDRIVS